MDFRIVDQFIPEKYVLVTHSQKGPFSGAVRNDEFHTTAYTNNLCKMRKYFSEQSRVLIKIPVWKNAMLFYPISLTLQ